MDFQKARARAKAAVMKHNRSNPSKVPTKLKTVKVFGVENLPELPQGKVNNEDDINSYMRVLRKTNEVIGRTLLAERKQLKAEKRAFKKLQNVNIVKTNLILEKKSKKISVKTKIKEMRKKRTFPQPKSYMNYKNRNGLLGRNSIKKEL